MKDMKVGFIGFGNMAQALARGFVRTGALSPDRIGACARDAAKLRHNTEPHGFRAFDCAEEVAAVGEGIIVCERRDSLSEAQRAAVEELLSHVGMLFRVDTPLLGVAGTVCGCGPAFVAMFIEALGDAAVKHGIPRADAYRMASRMLAGTARLQLETDRHPGAMKDDVCSPGGTTIVGVAELERRGFRAAVIDAVDAIEGKR